MKQLKIRRSSKGRETSTASPSPSPSQSSEEVKTSTSSERSKDKSGKSKSKSRRTKVVALYSQKKAGKGILTFQKGDKFTCDLTAKGEWLPASLNGEKGLVPRNYVKALPAEEDDGEAEAAASSGSNSSSSSSSSSSSDGVKGAEKVQSVTSAKAAAASRSRRMSSVSSRRGSVVRRSTITAPRESRSGSVIEHPAEPMPANGINRADVTEEADLKEGEETQQGGRDYDVQDDDDDDDDEDEEWFDIHFLERTGDKESTPWERMSGNVNMEKLSYMEIPYCFESKKAERARLAGSGRNGSSARSDASGTAGEEEEDEAPQPITNILSVPFFRMMIAGAKKLIKGRGKEAVAKAAEKYEKAIMNIVQKFRVNVYAKGQKVFVEGDIGKEFFIIVRGGFKVQKGGKDLVVLHPGNWFGEIAVMKWTRRTATVVANEPGVLLCLTSADFTEITKRHHWMARPIQEMVDKRTGGSLSAIPYFKGVYVCWRGVVAVYVC